MTSSDILWRLGMLWHKHNNPIPKSFLNSIYHKDIFSMNDFIEGAEVVDLGREYSIRKKV